MKYADDKASVLQVQVQDGPLYSDSYFSAYIFTVDYTLRSC